MSESLELTPEIETNQQEHNEAMNQAQTPEPGAMASEQTELSQPALLGLRRVVLAGRIGWNEAKRDKLIDKTRTRVSNFPLPLVNEPREIKHSRRRRSQLTRQQKKLKRLERIYGKDFYVSNSSENDNEEDGVNTGVVSEYTISIPRRERRKLKRATRMAGRLKARVSHKESLLQRAKQKESRPHSRLHIKIAKTERKLGNMTNRLSHLRELHAESRKQRAGSGRKTIAAKGRDVAEKGARGISDKARNHARQTREAYREGLESESRTDSLAYRAGRKYGEYKRRLRQG